MATKREDRYEANQSRLAIAPEASHQPEPREVPYYNIEVIPRDDGYYDIVCVDRHQAMEIRCKNGRRINRNGKWVIVGTAPIANLLRDPMGI